MRVLVCGGRDFNDLPLLDRTLDQLHTKKKIDVIIHGFCRGADLMAHFWAGANRVFSEAYIADWKKYDKKAGPIRNQRMLKCGKPDMVVAFKGGVGTKDMIRRAERAGIKVMRIGW